VNAWDVLHGDNVALLAAMPAERFSAIVTDPPYGIGFLGREWDTFAPRPASKRRAFHDSDRQRIVSDNPNLHGRLRSPAASPSQIAYDYSTQGLRRFQEWTAVWAAACLRVLKPGGFLVSFGAPRAYHRMACGLEDGGFDIVDSLAWLFGQGMPKSWNGLGGGRGTGLKPGHEPIVLAQKPFKGTIAECFATYGTAHLNIDACRLPGSKSVPASPRRVEGSGWGKGLNKADGTTSGYQPHVGRWPPNVALDQAAAALLDQQSGELGSGVMRAGTVRAGEFGYSGGGAGAVATNHDTYGDTGGASRFFYVAKPRNAERDRGVEHLAGGNEHPTVKPVELMRWLLRLVTPIGDDGPGLVLDPFLGSGTTGMAARLEGIPFVGIEREAEHVATAVRRIGAVTPLLALERMERISRALTPEIIDEAAAAGAAMIDRARRLWDR
jgi:DNA modification methylase